MISKMPGVKTALHAEDRRKERIPALDAEAIPRLQQLAKSQRVTPGFHNLPLKSRSGKLLGYAAYKTVGEQHDLVLATILGPKMRVKGKQLDFDFDTRVAQLLSIFGG